MPNKTNIFGEKPFFEHDCETCQFVRTVRLKDGKDHDMYVHLRVRNNAPEALDTYDLNYVFRASNEPSDYFSWTDQDVDFSDMPFVEPEPDPDESDDDEFDDEFDWILDV